MSRQHLLIPISYMVKLESFRLDSLSLQHKIEVEMFFWAVFEQLLENDGLKKMSAFVSPIIIWRASP